MLQRIVLELSKIRFDIMFFFVCGRSGMYARACVSDTSFEFKDSLVSAYR